VFASVMMMVIMRVLMAVAEVRVLLYVLDGVNG
jgi:hypothetical protein